MPEGSGRISSSVLGRKMSSFPIEKGKVKARRLRRNLLLDFLEIQQGFGFEKSKIAGFVCIKSVFYELD